MATSESFCVSLVTLNSHSLQWVWRDERKGKKKKSNQLNLSLELQGCLWAAERPFAFSSVALLCKYLHQDSCQIRWLYLSGVTEGSCTKGISTQMRIAGRKPKNPLSEEKGENQPLEIWDSSVRVMAFSKATGPTCSHLAGRKSGC